MHMDMHEVVSQFYQTLFTPDQDYDENLVQDFLRNYLPPHLKLSDEHNRDIILPITDEEANRALRVCRNGTATGFNGLPFEYYKMLVDTLAKPFAEMCTA